MEYMKTLEKNNIFELFENKTNIQQKILMCTGSALCLYMLMEMSLVSNFIGFIYPAYMSFKSLKTKKIDDDEQWLIYWIVYSLLSFMEICISPLFTMIPFYYHIKLIFLLWLSYDKTRGAQILYKKYIEPNLNQNELKFDELIKITEDVVNNVENMNEEEIINALPNHEMNNQNNMDKIEEKKCI